MSESGHISIHADNILPIIKKWLYSEKEIFLRELVSNGIDACHKLEKLNTFGEVETDFSEPQVKVIIDKDKKTLTFKDSGLGMTGDEIKKYINQVAFSGLTDFVEKYKGKGIEDQNIGHFGLGFYSSFMVAEKVEIETLSYKKDAKAVRWSCDGGTEFTLAECDKENIGTSIILHVSEDSIDMLEEARIKTLLDKYCSFVKYPLYLGEEQVNEPNPIWTKSPGSLNDDDYLGLFRKLFPYSPDPLFWIHLNVDHPFKLTGILYFPKIMHELDASEGNVKTFSNQVFVAENTKEVLPEWLNLLKGAIDCPDLPLNVSRSYLQNDPIVRKISNHIVKKVADKLIGLSKNDREKYQESWDDIHTFVKFGMMRDYDFYKRMIDHVIYRTGNSDYVTLDGYLEKMGEKTEKKIIYASDESLQSSYLKMFKEHGLEAIVADSLIDTHFLPYVEMKSDKLKFERIDADLSKHLLHDDEENPSDESKEASKNLSSLFEKFLGNEKIKVRVEPLKSEGTPGMLLFDENMRRFKEMGAMGQSGKSFHPTEGEHTLVVNKNNPAIRRILDSESSKANTDGLKIFVEQIYDLASLQQGKFTPEMMTKFIERSSTILEKYGQNIGNEI